ncbi:tetratricopeptide repeat protein [Singulisphaera sp. PoT]|uniref:tetratricopeptide repeat protein n=1 Tax=Singulisphaera sp. PoT TaxID=3411797 RepID=UPI003BF6097F
MVGLLHPRVLALAWTIGIALLPASTWAEPPADAKPANSKPQDTPRAQVQAETYALPGEDAPGHFVPKNPRSVDERRTIDAVRDFSTARALEDQRAWSEAVDLLQEGLKLEPDSVPILKRLSRLCFMRGKTEDGLKYARRVLDTEPGDTDTIARLVTHYARKSDFPAIESLLKEVLDNPRLEPHSSGRLLALYELGRLYWDRLNRSDKAAEAFAQVLDALDEKSANRLSPLDQARILGDDPAETYLDFGKAFAKTKRYDLAIKAFQRGLVYNEEHAQLPLSLAETYMQVGKNEEALSLVDHYIKRQPQGPEGFELLEKILTSLHREKDMTPRLEEAARLDSKNVPLQYALADHYHKIGQVDKAEAIYKSLLEAQPTPEGYSALAASLLKRKKFEDLLKVFAEALTRQRGFEAIKKQLEAVIKDPSLSDEVLDAGYKMLEDTPPRLDRIGVDILKAIGKESGKSDKLMKILRLTLKQDPTPQIYREIAHSLGEDLHKYDEASSTIVEMMDRFKEERNPRTLITLGDYLRRAGKYGEAIEYLREALKLDPQNAEGQIVLGWSLLMSGKMDEGFDTIRSLLKNDPANPTCNRIYASLLVQFGRNDEAISYLKELLQRYPNNDELFQIAHSSLSVAYVNIGDYGKGESELETLFQVQPDDPGVNNDLGYLYADQGKNLERAESMIRKALEEKPDESAYLDSLGWVLYKRGKFQEAVVPLEKAIKSLNSGGDATIHEHLGDVYFRLQENAKAKAAWEEAEKAAKKAIPSDKRLPEIRKKLESLSKLPPAAKPADGNSP